MFGAEDIALFFARLLLAIMFVVSALDKFRLDPVEMARRPTAWLAISDSNFDVQRENSSL